MSELGKQLMREIFEILNYAVIGTIVILNICFLLINYGHWKDIIIAETISIPLIYLISYFACRLGDKE